MTGGFQDGFQQHQAHYNHPVKHQDRPQCGEDLFLSCCPKFHDEKPWTTTGRSRLESEVRRPRSQHAAKYFLEQSSVEANEQRASNV